VTPAAEPCEARRTADKPELRECPALLEPSSDLAAAELGRYDVVVLRAGLEVPPGQPGSLPDHTDTVAILAHPAMAATAVF
jgi:hypothetical protein